jgi:hypothetical protein
MPRSFGGAPSNNGSHLVHTRTTLGTRQNVAECRYITSGGVETKRTVGFDDEAQPIAGF